MARPSSHPFDVLVARFAKLVTDRIQPLLAAPSRAHDGNGSRGPSKLRGRKRDMRCRYPGCRNRSKGPRFRFLCEEHLKLPRSAQKAALEKWAQKNA